MDRRKSQSASVSVSHYAGAEIQRIEPAHFASIFNTPFNWILIDQLYPDMRNAGKMCWVAVLDNYSGQYAESILTL